MTNHIEVVGNAFPGAEKIITPEALAFVGELFSNFSARHRELLGARLIAQQNYDAGILPDFSRETAQVRTGSWKVWPVPEELSDRRVEITGPASSRKMVVNALNSGAKVFMADAEDSESPTWENLVRGQLNLYDAIRGQIDFTDEKTGKEYKLKEKTALLFFRPRGFHLLEPHMTVNGAPVPASFFDFGLYAFHNAMELREHGHAAYFYLPKLESYSEARLWNQIFNYAEERLGLIQGEIKATVLIETLPAAFQMNEILFELKSHSAGLNCGRWDYIFSYIKKLKNHPEYVLPDRGQLTMDKGFLAAYVKLLIRTCHKRGTHAMGGMAAQIPVKDDKEANGNAMIRVKADKAREVKAGHDGTWVAHPALVPVAQEIFDLYMREPNQIRKMGLAEPNVKRDDLLAPIKGTITEAGIKKNLAVGIRYLHAWLSGTGAAALYNLMEDAATAEISRCQLWQWRKHAAKLDDGQLVDRHLIYRCYHEVMTNDIELGEIQKMNVTTKADQLFLDSIFSESLYEFLTIPAQVRLLEQEINSVQ